jgi:hypothetical protein
MEIHEQPWCPTILRDGLRGVLEQIASKLPSYDAIVDELRGALARLGTREVVDLCAGAGGPWVRLGPALRGELDSVLLTDLFPDRSAVAAIHQKNEGLVRGHGEPVDAFAVPPEFAGLRTLFTAFHHFEPERAEQLLRDAAKAGRGVAIFEQTQRSWVVTALVGLSAAPLGLLLIPFVRPLRPGLLLWTYVIPVIPALLSFDGVVSCLRSYTPHELEALGRRAAPHYRWRAGLRRTRCWPLPVVFLIGLPR